MTVYSLGYEDPFGTMIVDQSSNRADIAGHYPFNPERLRLFVNGTRQFVQYGSIAGYSDAIDEHRLTPQSDGDVMTLETNERYRYVVGYAGAWSIAASINQSLQSGEVVILGYGDADLENSGDDDFGPAADGWFMRFHSGIGDSEVELAMLRAGTKLDNKTVSLNKAIDIYSRYGCTFNWYSVGNADFEETFTKNGEQKNPTVGRISNDDGKGPETANKPVQASVKAKAGAGNLTLNVGSIGYKILGNVSGITREKTASFDTSISTTGSWVPIHAVRVDPDRKIVNMQLTDVSVMEFSGAADIKVMVMAFDPSKVKDSGGNDIVDGDFSAPSEHNPTNSVLQSSTAVAQFPNNSGTVGTSAANPGGYQLGYASLYSSGASQNADRARGGDKTRKRQISDRDIVVFLAKAGATGTVSVEYSVEQDW